MSASDPRSRKQELGPNRIQHENTWLMIYRSEVMINRCSSGHSYLSVKGEIIGFVKDGLLRKHLSRRCYSMKPSRTLTLGISSFEISGFGEVRLVLLRGYISLSLSLSLYIYIYIYIYICIYTYRYIYIYVYVRIHIHIIYGMYLYVCVYIYIYIYTCTCLIYRGPSGTPVAVYRQLSD